MFDIGFPELMVILVVALFVLGPDKLPKFAAEAGRMLRQLRTMAQGAKDEVTGSLGPEFSDLQLSDLDPRNFVKRQLLEETDDLEKALSDDTTPPKPTNGSGPERADRTTASEPAVYEGDAT